MATWNRVANGSTAGNISMNVDIGIQSVTRTSNSNVRVVYGVRFAMATNTYTYNNIAAFCPKDSGNRYYAFGGNGSSHTNIGTWYYANSTKVSTTTDETCPFTIDIPVTLTQTSASFEVGYGWNGYTPAQKGSSSITVTFPTGATAPTGLYCYITGRTETTATLNGGYNSDGGASVTGSGYQYSTNGSSWTNCNSSVSGLSPNTTYYFRYYAGNSVGTSYSGNSSTTTYDYPKPTSMNNFTIGNGASVNLYNPLGRNVTLQILQESTNTVLGTYSGTYNGIVNGEFKTADAISRQYASIPASKTGTYYCKVTYGSITKTLNDAKNHTYSIAQSDAEKPLFDSSYIINVVNGSHTDISGTNKFISGHNSLSGTIKPMVPQKSATADYYSISTSGLSTVTKTYSTSNQSFLLGNMVSNAFNITAIDKRGMSRTVTTNIDLVSYNKPSVTTAKITRQNGIGTKAILAFSGKYTNWTGLLKTNSIQSIRYKIGASGTWKSLPSDATLTSSGGTWTLNTVLNDDFATTSQYNLYLEIKDLLETVTTNAYTISTADAFIWKDLANKRVGIGKKPDYALDVNGDIRGTNIRATSHIYPAGQVRKGSAGNWIADRDKAAVVQTDSGSDGHGYAPIISQKTKNGNWTIGAYQDDALIFCYTSDSNYPNNNTHAEWRLPVPGANYSTNNIALLSRPIGSIYISNSNTNPGTIFGGTWVCERATAGGELIAFGVVNGSGMASKTAQAGTWYAFSSEETSYYKTPTIQNYISGILEYTAGTLKCHTKGIVGMVESHMYISGRASTTNQGFWFGGNKNNLPTGVTFLPDNGNGVLVGGGAVSNQYGGQGITNFFLVDTNSDVEFYINPSWCPYQGNFEGCNGGVKSQLLVKVYAKAGYYVWRRTA